MTEQPDTLPISGEGYANLTDDSSFAGRITVEPNWVTVTNPEGRYSIPRRRIDFINWKEANGYDD